MTLPWGDGELLGFDLVEAPPVENTARKALLDLVVLSTDDTPEGLAAEDAAWRAIDDTGQAAWQRAILAITQRVTEVQARAQGFAYSAGAVLDAMRDLAASMGCMPASDYGFGPSGLALLRFRWLDGTFVCWEGLGDSRTGFWRQAVHDDTPSHRKEGLAGEPRWVALAGDGIDEPVTDDDLTALPCRLHGGPLATCRCPLMRAVLRGTSVSTLASPATPDGPALHAQLSAPLQSQTAGAGSSPTIPQPAPAVTPPPEIAREPEEATHAGAYHGRRPELADAPAPEWEAPIPATTAADWMRRGADALPVTFLVACTNDGTCRASFNVSMDPSKPESVANALKEARCRPCPDCAHAGRDGGLLVPRLTDDPGLSDTPTWARLMATRGIVRGYTASMKGQPCMVCQADVLDDDRTNASNVVCLERHGLLWLADVDCVISVGILEGGPLRDDRRTVLTKDSNELCATCSQPFTRGVARVLLGPEHGPHYPCHERTLDCTAAQEAARFRAERVAREQTEKAASAEDWTKAKPHVLKARADKRPWKCALCKLEVAPGIEVAMKLDRKIAHGSCQKKEAALVAQEKAQAQATNGGD